jgi:predicted nucleic acid-binding protein
LIPYRTIWISRQVIREYLVTKTRPQAFENLPRATLLEQIEQFTERFEVADDTSAATERLLQLLANYKLGGKQVHDANIVAAMQTYGIPALLTHNTKDFERFGDAIRIERI